MCVSVCVCTRNVMGVSASPAVRFILFLKNKIKPTAGRKTTRPPFTVSWPSRCWVFWFVTFLFKFQKIEAMTRESTGCKSIRNCCHLGILFFLCFFYRWPVEYRMTVLIQMEEASSRDYNRALTIFLLLPSFFFPLSTNRLLLESSRIRQVRIRAIDIKPNTKINKEIQNQKVGNLPLNSRWMQIS